MSEERTQNPSKRRRQQARELGQVARSPELTAAVGLLAAVSLLGFWGDELALALIGLVRESWQEAILVADPAEVIARLRHLMLGVAGPLFGLIGGVVVATVAAHQIQVGGLWVPGLLAPDPARLWVGGQIGLASRATRGAWAIVKAIILVSMAAWSIRSHLPAFRHLAELEPTALARASGGLLRNLTASLAIATLVIGLLDYLHQYRRFEAQLRLTPQQEREDQRADDGNPALRARRRRVAQAWGRDPVGTLRGAAVVLVGPSGLSVVLGGGPPPRRVIVREVARGPSGPPLRRAARRSGVPVVDAPELALRLARRASARLPLPPRLRSDLAALWPPQI
jgi:flagellar biosynthetic protein FlhB